MTVMLGKWTSPVALPVVTGAYQGTKPLGRAPTAGDGDHCRGAGETRGPPRAQRTMYYIHQVRNTEGVGGYEWNSDRIKRGIGLYLEPSLQTFTTFNTPKLKSDGSVKGP